MMKTCRQASTGFLLALTVSLAGTFTHAPAQAQFEAQSFFEGGDFDFQRFDLSRVLGQAYRQLEQALSETIADNFEADTAGLLQEVIGRATGVLGFPSPAALARELEGELAALPQPDVTQPVPVAESGALSRDLNRLLLREQIETVLGQDGQRLAQEKVETTASAVATTEQLAWQADAAISTQAAIKAMALQQAQSTALMGAVHTELLQSRQDTAAQSLALQDISASLDQQLTTQQAERRGEAITGLQQAAAARLF